MILDRRQSAFHGRLPSSRSAAPFLSRETLLEEGGSLLVIRGEKSKARTTDAPQRFLPMGDITQPDPVLLLLAAFSRYGDALDWARDHAAAAWGPVAVESPRFDFTETDYYEPTMGPGLAKCFWAFERLVDPAVLVERKTETNAWETEYAESGAHPEPRPLNLDPGYLTPAKLVLASTKDHAHRLYLSRGVYAEVTLFYKDRGWQHRDWTFPDYRRGDYQEFFSACRAYLRRREREDRRR